MPSCSSLAAVFDYRGLEGQVLPWAVITLGTLTGLYYNSGVDMDVCVEPFHNSVLNTINETGDIVFKTGVLALPLIAGLLRFAIPTIFDEQLGLAAGLAVVLVMIPGQSLISFDHNAVPFHHGDVSGHFAVLTTLLSSMMLLAGLDWVYRDSDSLGRANSPGASKPGQCCQVGSTVQKLIQASMAILTLIVLPVTMHNTAKNCHTPEQVLFGALSGLVRMAIITGGVFALSHLAVAGVDCVRSYYPIWCSRHRSEDQQPFAKSEGTGYGLASESTQPGDPGTQL